ncbi:transposase, partial [Myxococcota bacterium]|nr:transposase [Myxococcota bacterium]
MACYVQGKDQKFDLPLYITAGTANQHDSVMMPDLISRLYRTIEASDTHKRIHAIIADAGYDAIGIYRFIRKIGAHPIIPLNPHNRTPIDVNGVPRDDKGRPLCPGGIPMRFHGVNRRTERVVYF